MTTSLERKEGGSVALFINGDLQFDSTDERIYHEALALPALALATKRSQSPLKVLVIGGGDGLIARELFKSPQVASLDLVDYDPEILDFARIDLSLLNQGSLSDSRIKTHVKDAWDFVDQALESAASFDLIVSDLTVAETLMDARFHSVEWYTKLAGLLSDGGVLATNGVSPQATPQAYWSIFNSILKAALHARPYHVSIPSFSASGYGEDWGFFIAAREPIAADELDIDPSIPRQVLLDSNELRRLFIFPEELFSYQPNALPALVGSDILLHYFNNSTVLAATSNLVRDAFSLDTASLFVPAPDSGKHILPPELCSALAKSICSSEQYDNTQSEGVQLFLHEVLDLMPSLQRAQTSALIGDFLQAPTRFLQAIDLPGLVSRLLRRAAELPSHLVTELKLLQNNLVDWADDQENLLALGQRAFTVLILAIVVGNLLYPDAVYGKGPAGGHGHTGGHHGLGRAWGGGGWVGGGTYYNNGRVINPIKKGPIGPGPNDAAVKRMQKQGSLPQRNDISDAEYIDENGNTYPARRYRTAQLTGQASADSSAVYRLGPGADILADGRVAMPLTDRSYLLVMPHAMHVIDQSSGHNVMALQNNPELLHLTAAEIDRQLRQLAEDTNSSSSVGATETTEETALYYLNKANEVFQNVERNPESDGAGAVAAGVEVFPSVYLTADGQYLAFQREGGQIAYLDGKNWYADLGSLPLNEPYPTHFKSIALSYLTKMVREATATKNMLLTDKVELAAHLDVLSQELSQYQTTEDSLVRFGTRKMPREEAMRLTQLAAGKTAQQIQALDKHLEQLPKNVDVAKIALQNLSGERPA